MEGTIRPSIRLTLEKEERFFGPGVADLLELVEEKGSIQGACSEMGMSYSKSWKIIKRAERELGYPLLSSHNGGTAGGKSELTEKESGSCNNTERWKKPSGERWKMYSGSIFRRNRDMEGDRSKN